MKVSKLISKPVISLYEAQRIAVVLRVNLANDLHKVKSLTVFDTDDNEYQINIADIFAIGDNIVLKNASKLKAVVCGEDTIIGKHIYSSDGKDFGLLVDIEINEKYEVEAIITDKQQINNFDVLIVSEEIIFKGEKDIKVNALKPRVKLFNVSKLADINVKAQTQNKIEKQPIKYNGNTNLLLTRRVTNDIIGKNRELIAKKNQIINEKVIETAIMHNKINLLFINSVIN